MFSADSLHPFSAVAAEERRLLGDLRELLATGGGSPDLVAALRQSLLDLDSLFLLVAAGEFNAGKSALINALLGEKVLVEGVTPTTAAVTLVKYGDSARQVDREDGLLELRFPLPLLRDLAVVDTPGTNAILRQHEQLTREFIPRSDLLLFVTSADRPFTESERGFLEQVRQWGKKIVVILNKTDLLAGPEELQSQVAFIREGAQRLLGLDPPIWPVSARVEGLAGQESDPAVRQRLHRESGFEELRRYLDRTLDDGGRLSLKLRSALGVAQRAIGQHRQSIDARVGLLHVDQDTSREIDAYLTSHTDEQRREFQFRLDRLHNLFYDLNERGQRFFESNIRLARVFDLAKPEKVRADFEREVVTDVPQRVEDLTQDLIEWLVDQDQRVWKWVSSRVENRAEGAYELNRAGFEAPFNEDRRAVLQNLLRTTREVLRRHDHRRQAEELAAGVRDTVTRTTLVEAGALGFGALTVAIVGSVAADVTGLLAAGMIASMGLYLLPMKRRRLEQQFKERTEELRQTLAAALTREFESSLESSAARAQAALAPYQRFVTSELQRLSEQSKQLETIKSGMEELRANLQDERISPGPAGESSTASSAMPR